MTIDEQTAGSPQENLDALLERIAKKHLHFPTLQRRWSDRLDFRDCACWDVKDALEAAFKAGMEVGAGIVVPSTELSPRRDEAKP